MGLKPQFRLIANAQDITDAIKPRLIQLSYTDQAGFESDALEVQLSDDQADPIKMPPTGAELELSLGYDGEAVRMGLFVVDEITLSGWPRAMTIRARAAPFEQSKGGKVTLQTQKSRSWKRGQKLGAVVAKIAGEHGMQSAVSPSLASIVLPHFDQTDESDMNFLVRIGRRYDAVLKPAGGRLIFAKRGETKSMGGTALPPVEVRPADVSGFDMRLSRKEDSGTVTATWRAKSKAKQYAVKIGTGEPVRRIRTAFASEAEARAAAQAEFDRRQRGKATLSVDMVGDPAAVAEAPLTASGFGVGVDGQWIITRAEHRLDGGGYSCRIDAEAPGDAEGANIAVDEE